MFAAQRILLVEDDPDQLLLFMQILSTTGYAIITATSGEAALARLHEESFDLLLTDRYLPVIAGDDLIRMVKADLPALKTILMSNHHGVREIAESCGADGWFHKHDAINYLRTMVTDMLSS